MPQLCEHDLCVGCGACANICPKGCIHMAEDPEGFLYPRVEEDRCVSCGLCQKACPVLDKRTRTAPLLDAYAAHHRNSAVVSGSSSGGVFTALAVQIIRDGGVVYGAAFQEDLSVAHTRAETMEDLAAFRGAKYLQSRIGDAYAQVRQDLQSGRRVLFSGTPCQVAALDRYLGREYENLLSVDIICHSVPSLKAWRHYLRTVENQEHQRAAAASFRDKRTGWQNYQLRVTLADGREHLCRGNENNYMRSMIQGLSARRSCFSCSFKGQNRRSDITLGDFWGIETACPEALHENGTSLVLVQTEKGKQALEQVGSKLVLTPVDPAAALSGNPAYSAPGSPHPERDRFYALLDQEPFDKAVKRLLSSTTEERRQQKWQQSLPMRAARKLKRLLGGTEKT